MSIPEHHSHSIPTIGKVKELFT